MPKSRVDFWQKKFDDNVRRDAAVKAELLERGIKCLIVWECTIKRMMKDSQYAGKIINECRNFSSQRFCSMKFNKYFYFFV